MSYYGDDAKTDATETRRRKLQQWDETLDAYAFDKRNDLRATDGACALRVPCSFARARVVRRARVSRDARAQRARSVSMSVARERETSLTRVDATVELASRAPYAA